MPQTDRYLEYLNSTQQFLKFRIIRYWEDKRERWDKLTQTLTRPFLEKQMYLLVFLCLYLTTGGCLLRLEPPLRLQTSTSNSAENILLWGARELTGERRGSGCLYNYQPDNKAYFYMLLIFIFLRSKIAIIDFMIWPEFSVSCLASPKLFREHYTLSFSYFRIAI